MQSTEQEKGPAGTHRLIVDLRANNQDTRRHAPGPPRHFKLYQTAKYPNAHLMVEEWDREAMNAHSRSRDFRVALSVIDRSRETPGVQIDLHGPLERSD